MSQASIGIGMIGCGTVGSGVVKLLRDHGDLYAKRCGHRLELCSVLVRDLDKARQGGSVDPQLVTDDADAFFATDNMQVIIEVAGGVGAIGDYVRRAIKSGRHIVTANKSLLGAEGAQLYALARKHQVAIAFEASCGGGIPIVTALQFGLMANDIHAMYGILNGTCNYILTEMTQRGSAYDDVLKQAQQLGYAEADSALDVSGRDAAQKLAVLASIAFGVHVADEDVWSEGIDTLHLDDIRFGRELGYDIKLLAIAERTQEGVSVRVHPCFIHGDQQLANVHGSFNALSVYGHATGHTMYFGRGAGQMPTAGAVVSDLLNVAGGWYQQAFLNMNLWPDTDQPATITDAADLCGRFYLRVNALDVPGIMASITHALGDAGISIAAVLQHEENQGKFVPVVILTHDARQGAIDQAATTIENLDCIDGKPIVIRVVEFPEG